jgi:hypothetical protein
MLNEILALPEIKALWTGNPLDLVGIGFFLLLLYALVGGTISMFKNQVKYITHAILKRRAAGEVHSYTKSLIDGTAPELRALRSCTEPARRKRIIAGIVNTLEVQDSSPVARAMVKSFRRLA